MGQLDGSAEAGVDGPAEAELGAPADAGVEGRRPHSVGYNFAAE